MINETITLISAIVASFGGCEMVKYLLNRRSNSRIAHAQAYMDEFHALREYNEFLQEQLRRKDENYAEQTLLVRKLNAEILKVTEEKTQAEMELKMKRCEVRNCPNRQPKGSY